MKNTLIIVFVILFSCSATFAIAPTDVINTNTDLNAKHYDPGHNGHKHKCKSCGRLYNQPGDSYQNSPGTYTCPSCGFYNGPVQPPYNPPTPPYNPPYNPPSYDTITADQIIRHAQKAYSYSEGDRILVAGARRLTDVSGILKIATVAHSNTNRKQILNNLNLQKQFTNFPDYRLLTRLYDRCSTYSAGDELIMYSARHIHAPRDLMFLAVKLHSSTSAKQYIHQIKTRTNLQGRISLNDVRTAYNSSTTYSIGDELLEGIMRFFRNYDELMTLSQMAYSSRTRRIIQDYAYKVQPHNGGGYYNNQYRTNKLDLTIEAAGDEGINLEKNGITVENMKNIEKFVADYKAGKIKKSPKLATTVDSVKDFAKTIYLQTNDDKYKEMLETLK